MKDNKVIQVCEKCNKASCWYGEFMCEESGDADTKFMTVGELKKLSLESEDYWSDKYMKSVYGAENPFVNDGVKMKKLKFKLSGLLAITLVAITGTILNDIWLHGDPKVYLLGGIVGLTIGVWNIKEGE